MRLPILVSLQSYWGRQGFSDVLGDGKAAWADSRRVESPHRSSWQLWSENECEQVRGRGWISDRLREERGENGRGSGYADQAGWPGHNGHLGGTTALVMPQPGPLGCVSPASKCRVSKLIACTCGNLAATKGRESTERSQGALAWQKFSLLNCKGTQERNELKVPSALPYQLPNLECTMYY